MRETDMRELPKLNGVVIGRLEGFAESGAPLVSFEGSPTRGAHVARTLVAIRDAAVGSELALLFENDDAARPLVLGVVKPPEMRTSAEVDGEKIEIRASREISLRVGKASITLTADGKVLIRGEYLLSRSSGPNRIRGGSIELN